MKPYYSSGGITIYNEDCREIIESIPAFDLLVTDPPYGMRFISNYRKVPHRAIHGDEGLPIGAITAGIERSRAAAYVFCRWDNLYEMPKPRSVVAWVKNNWSMGDLKHEHGRMWEACCFYPRDNHAFVSRIPDVIHADKTGNTLHPTQKPVSLIERIISANRCEVVADIFCGSGTTLLAAKLCGKQAIGVEIDESYCEVAANRLSQEIMF